MSVLTRVVEMIGRLPPAQTHRIDVERDLVVEMADGVTLYADRYVPRGTTGLPIVLLRGPYGRGGFAGLTARLFAERGYQAVVQEVRGTGSSGGEFNALREERRDGLRTLDWLAEQPWFSGSVGMTGLSYLGHAQWAIAADAPPFVQALAIQVIGSEIRSGLYHGENFALYTSVRWAGGMGAKKNSMGTGLGGRLRERGRLVEAVRHLPLRDADTIVAGEHVRFFQEWLDHAAPGDPYWDENDYSRRMGDIGAKVSLMAGWYDLFLPRQLADYTALRAAGGDVRLTVGPWHHSQIGGFLAGVRDGLEWLDLHLRGIVPKRPIRPVRIFVMGANTWRSLPDWPPPSTPTRWHLRTGRYLRPEPPTAGAGSPDAAPDFYRYDPANPTPSLGGILLRGDAGQRDDRELEARPDILTYSSPPLAADVEAIGPVSADLFVRASRPDFDLFVRICDVGRNGRSVNVCDGPLRVTPDRHAPDADGVVRVRVDLWPTAYRFRLGHRIRVHVSSGAFPRISRNLGGGEPFADATEMHVVDIEVLHDAEHPSAVMLPIVAAGRRGD